MLPPKTRAETAAPPLKRRGGALIGWTHAGWPLATLEATQSELTLKAFLLGTYKFRPGQIVRFEERKSFVVSLEGMRIRHVVPDCPRRIFFGCRGGAKRLIEEIHATGFTPCARAEDLARFQGSPLKGQTILIAVMLIVVLSVAGFIEHFLRAARGSTNSGPGVSFFIAVLLFFLSCLAILWLRPFQRLLLKPERSAREIRPVVVLFALLSGIILFAYAITAIVQAPR